MLLPVNNEMTLVCNGERTFTCSSTLYTVSKPLERVVQQKKRVMSRGKGSFMDIEMKEGCDVTAALRTSTWFLLMRGYLLMVLVISKVGLAPFCWKSNSLYTLAGYWLYLGRLLFTYLCFHTTINLPFTTMTSIHDASPMPISLNSNTFSLFQATE